MCQAYEGERAWVIRSEEIDRENGRPYFCDFLAGYFSCTGHGYDLSHRYKHDKGYGWECQICGTWYPSKEN